MLAKSVLVRLQGLRSRARAPIWAPGWLRPWPRDSYGLATALPN